MLCALVFTFILLRLLLLKLPGSVVDFLSDSESNVQELQKLSSELSVKTDFYTQFMDFFTLNWGQSALYGRDVLSLIYQHFKITLVFSLSALFLSFAISLCFFLLSKKSASFLVRVLLSIPPLALFPLAVFFLCKDTSFCPAGNSNVFISVVVASLIQALLAAPRFYRELDWELDEIRKKRFVLVLRGKGLSKKVIWIRHIFLNVVPPLLSLLTLTFLGFVSGSVLVEALLDIPGIGVLLLEAIRARDYLLLFPLLMFLSLLHLLILRSTKIFKKWRLVFGDS